MGPSRRREFGFAFVPVDDAGKPKGSSNVGLVRRHCMKGKNRTIGVPPKRVGARPPQKRYAQTSADGQHVAAERDHRDEDEEDAWSSVWDSLTLPLAPSTISLIQLAFHVDNRGKGLLFRFIDTAMKNMYPKELWVDVDPNLAYWAQYLAKDPVYLQSALFTTSASMDIAMQGPISPMTYVHLSRAMAQLNKAISRKHGDVRALAQSTVTVVWQLATFSCLIHDHTSAAAHTAGLLKMIRLCGGLENFRGNAKLCMQVGRISMAYDTNEGRDLYSSPILPQRPFFYDIEPIYPDDPGLACPSTLDLFDPLILPVFIQMHGYFSVLNEGPSKRRYRPESELQMVVFSLHHRLMQLQGAMSDLPSEGLRLGMLALLTTPFQFPGTRTAYPHLAEQIREVLRELDDDSLSASADLRAFTRWLMIVSSVSVINAELECERWMEDKWKAAAIEIAAWDDVRKELKEFVWIQGLHDYMGRKVVNRWNCARAW